MFEVHNLFRCLLSMLTYLTNSKAQEPNIHVKEDMFIMYIINAGFFFVCLFCSAPAGTLTLTKRHERVGHGLLGTTVCTVNR